MDGTLELKEPLTGPRLTLLGEVQVSPDQAGDKARYLKAHPEAELYAGFGDFRFYRFRIIEGLFVAGFGRIFRLTAEELRADAHGQLCGILLPPPSWGRVGAGVVLSSEDRVEQNHRPHPNPPPPRGRGLRHAGRPRFAAAHRMRIAP